MDATVSEGRRRLLKLMAASAALAGSGCSEPPQEEILPYVRMPERQVPGHPVFYASTLCRQGYGFGVLVETNMGRPTKIEGNPEHPASLGATDAIAQAAILELWDPDRSRTVRFNDQVSTWDAFQAALQERLPALRDRGGLRILTGPLTSPTLTARIQDLLQQYPQARWHRHDPAGSVSADAAIRSIYTPNEKQQTGIRLDYDLKQVQTLATLDADIFSSGPASVRLAREFMQGRGDDPGRSLLYAVETTPTAMGVKADSRLSMQPLEIEALVVFLASCFGLADDMAASDYLTDEHRQWGRMLADRLAATRPHSLLIGGPALSEASHRLAWRLNEHLGLMEQNRAQRARACMAPAEGISSLIRDMEDGQVDTLLIVDVNPAYDLPARAGFAQALEKVSCSIHMDLYANETAGYSTWHLPRCHDLEDWSDARSTEGTASIIQPAIASLYGARSPHWLLGLLAETPPASAYDDVRDYWYQRWGLKTGSYETRWHDALRRGVIDEARQPLIAARRAMTQQENTADAVAIMDTVHRRAHASAHGGEVMMTAMYVNDSSIETGACANLSWLQELPRPMTQITWDNAALIGYETAVRHGLITGDVVVLQDEEQRQRLEAPVYVLAGHAEACISLPLGYGRRRGGQAFQGVGFDAFALQEMGPKGPQRTGRVLISMTGKRHAFARVQTEHDDHERPIIEHVGMDEWVQQDLNQPSLYPEREYRSHAWGMTIDLDTCIGCNACVTACQAENNIPVVGKEEVARGRSMHWIRVNYYEDGKTGGGDFQPMACQHCENAPCEVVCPVGATVHDSEGLNVQVYNRCVGTRFCSNNCPYKARRFNFFQYSDQTLTEFRARRNPEVTVRERGVMEKCTYCVQRISRARIEAEKRGTPIRDGDVVTACQAVCPTEAIVFGDINDPDSRVSLSKESPRNYRVLDELNTRPRTSWLARVDRKGGRHG
ncbi:MAG TPA: 4Fe-4S dicluster domain-containing protein [Burkholderiaceae bacterium]|nr:4Fe-4S dicluster domain-containing protein [Burkholderiaceae bacterium]